MLIDLFLSLFTENQRTRTSTFIFPLLTLRLWKGVFLEVYGSERSAYSSNIPNNCRPKSPFSKERLLINLMHTLWFWSINGSIPLNVNWNLDHRFWTCPFALGRATVFDHLSQMEGVIVNTVIKGEFAYGYLHCLAPTSQASVSAWDLSLQRGGWEIGIPTEERSRKDLRRSRTTCMLQKRSIQSTRWHVGVGKDILANQCRTLKFVSMSTNSALPKVQLGYMWANWRTRISRMELIWIIWSWKSQRLWSHEKRTIEKENSSNLSVSSQRLHVYAILDRLLKFWRFGIQI